VVAELAQPVDVAPQRAFADLEPIGQLPPTSGSAEVAGFDVVTHQSEVWARIGYIGQGNGAGHSQRGRDDPQWRNMFPACRPSPAITSD
jgi:hypothetical protein